MKELHEPVGWVRVPLYAPVAGGAAAAIAADAAGGTEGPVLRAHFVQICVVAMHQNGRDTHIRQVGIACCSPDRHSCFCSVSKRYRFGRVYVLVTRQPRET